MLVLFKLSTPGIGSWNGKWSGSNKIYARVKNFRSKKDLEKIKPILEKGYYSYSFGDGWRAGISVEEVNSAEAKALRRKSDGFCGYDWMIDSIIKNGTIK